MTEKFDFDIMQLIPGTGWNAWYLADEGTFAEPLVGWAVRRDGIVVPLGCDVTGQVDDVRGDHNLVAVLPSADEVPPAKLVASAIVRMVGIAGDARDFITAMKSVGVGFRVVRGAVEWSLDVHVPRSTDRALLQRSVIDMATFGDDFIRCIVADQIKEERSPHERDLLAAIDPSVAMVYR